MSLDLGELVATISADDRPLDIALEHGMSALRSFAADGEKVATTAGQRIADAAADPLRNGGTAAGSAFALDAVDALKRADAGMGAAGGQAADEYSSQFSDTMKTVGKTAGAAAGLAITAGVVDNMNIEAGRNKLATQLNLTTGEAKVAGKAAGDIYGNNFGESLGQVNDAIALVSRNMDIDINSVNLQPATEKVLTLADAFDQDLGMTTAAVGQLMRTGMAKDATAALDLITRGLQSPVNKADDLLETFNEYGTQFRKLGLDGPTALGLLNQAVLGGARDADVAGDSLKEFSIRTLGAIETMDSKGRPQLTELGQAFTTLGLDGYAMQDKIAAGGPGATEALDSVVKAFRGVEDPITKATAFTALFGTQYEDMGAAIESLDVTTAADSIGKVSGAAQDAVDKMGSGNQATIETYKRKILGVGQDAIESVGPLTAVAGAVAAFGPAALSVIGPIATIVAARATQTAAAGTAAAAEGAGATATVVGWATSAAAATAGAARTAGAWLLSKASAAGTVVLYGVAFAMMAAGWIASGVASMAGAVVMAAAWLVAIWPIALVVAAIAGVVFLVIKYWDDIVAATTAAWDWVTGKISAAVSWVVGFVKGNWPLLLGIITGPIGLAVALVAKYWDNIRGAAGDAWNGIKSTVSNGAQGIVDAVQAIPGKLRDLGSKFKDAGGDLVAKLIDGLGASGAFVADFAEKIWNAVKGAINKGIDKLNGLLEFTIKIPGAPDIHVNAPNIGHLAKGTSNWRGGPTWVGEQGPEILNLPQGSQVIPNHKTGTYVTDPESERTVVLQQTIQTSPGMSPQQIGDSAASAIMFGLTGPR